MDRLDLKIASFLQKDASKPIADIAAAVGLSQTACWRRIRLLEETGVIRRRVALLDPGKLNAAVTVFVALRTNQHNREWLDRFARNVTAIPEIVELYRMSGETDYLLKVMVPDIEGYDEVYKKLIAAAELSDVSSSFAMEQIKYTTEVPLGFVRLD